VNQGLSSSDRVLAPVHFIAIPAVAVPPPSRKQGEHVPEAAQGYGQRPVSSRRGSAWLQSTAREAAASGAVCTVGAAERACRAEDSDLKPTPLTHTIAALVLPLAIAQIQGLGGRQHLGPFDGGLVR
jgi:hypothetical protein